MAILLLYYLGNSKALVTKWRRVGNPYGYTLSRYSTLSLSISNQGGKAGVTRAVFRRLIGDCRYRPLRHSQSRVEMIQLEKLTPMISCVGVHSSDNPQ